MKNGLIGILVFALAVESFFLVRRDQAESAPPEAASVSIRETDEGLNETDVDLQAENERLRRQIVELERERDVTQMPIEAVPAAESIREPEPPLSPMRMVTELDDRGVISVSMRLLNNDGSINDGVIELYELEPEEVDSIATAVERTRVELRRITEENSTVSTDEEGRLVITTEPFTETGASIHDELLEVMETTLGEERHRSLLRLVGESFERDFERFGAMRQSVTISRREEEDGHNDLWVERREETGRGTGFQSRSFSDREEFLDAYPNLRNVIPVDIPFGESP